MIFRAVALTPSLGVRKAQYRGEPLASCLDGYQLQLGDDFGNVVDVLLFHCTSSEATMNAAKALAFSATIKRTTASSTCMAMSAHLPPTGCPT